MQLENWIKQQQIKFINKKKKTYTKVNFVRLHHMVLNDNDSCLIEGRRSIVYQKNMFKNATHEERVWLELGPIYFKEW